jgi:hypothetical protein
VQKKAGQRWPAKYEEVLRGMNLEEPIYIYRQVQVSLKGKKKGFLFFLS